MPETAATSTPQLRRTLSVFDGITILVGLTIGAGIFSTPQRIAGYFDDFTPIVTLWIIAGVFIFIGGLIYAELGSRMPNTGGEYVYITRSFGPFAGFMFGWAQLFIIRTSPVAGLAIVSVDYLGHFIEMDATTRMTAALVIITLIGSINYVGIQHASMYQKLSALGKVTGIMTLIVVGLLVVGDQNDLLWSSAPATNNLGPTGNVVAALMLIVFSYLGFERVGYSAGEMKNPKRAIPLSMFIGIAAVVVIYVLTNILYHQVFGMEDIRSHTRVASDAAIQLLGPVGAGFIAITVMVSATGSINGTMMTAPRVYYAMARDGIFFKWFDHVHPIFRTPSHAILAHCIWGAVILIVRGSFEAIVTGMVFAILISMMLNTLALFKFRNAGGEEADVYHVPFYPWLPGLYLIGVIALIVLRAIYEWQNSLIDLTFIATGLPFSLIWLKKMREKQRVESRG